MGEIESLKEVLKESFSKIRDDINNMSLEINKIKKENSILQEKLKNFENNKKKIDLKTEIITKIDKNKKQIIKQKIIELIRFKKAPISEIKEIIVDEQEYCSKASFYRYIEELKRDEKINSIIIDEKEIYV